MIGRARSQLKDALQQLQRLAVGVGNQKRSISHLGHWFMEILEIGRARLDVITEQRIASFRVIESRFYGKDGGKSSEDETERRAMECASAPPSRLRC